MITTRYLGMMFGKFKVIGFYYSTNNNIVNLKVKCGCKKVKEVKLSYEKILKIKCANCGRFDVVIPISYYSGTKLVKDTVTIGEYKYKKLKTQYLESTQTISEIDFIIKRIFKNETK